MSRLHSGRLLHIRSLNHLAREHLFTYAGARALAESLHPTIIDVWTDDYIARKSQTGRRQVYWKHSLFKGFDRNQKPEYRKCVVGSPTTHLTEVWLLSRLSQDKAFALPSCVYSYLWSHFNSTHVYRYFFRGYMEREHQIGRVAAEMANSRVVILDLKKFYPSIDVPAVRARFEKRVNRSGLSLVERETAVQCVEELTSIKHEVGLPTGPPLSHMLANVFLEDFDSKLCDEFGDQYFRYVDDIAIVVPSGEVESAQRFFEGVATEDGLKVNSDKVDILTGEDWAARVRHREQDGDDSVARLVSDLRRYLAHNLGDFDRVRDAFRAEGFSFPFSRLRSVATSSPFRRFVKGFWSHSGGLFGRNIPRPDSLLERARSLRRLYRSRLRQAAERSIPPSGMARRWALQDLRYLLNRSLYLLPVDEWKDLLDLIPDCLELRPSRAVLSALVTGDASALTKYPGPTVAAFCELWAETSTAPPRIDWSAEPAREERDGASVLALCGLCNPPDHWTSHFREQSSQIMVALSARQCPSRRTFDDFSYIDEMESLLLSPRADVANLLKSRFDDGEDVVLPVLSLGGIHYMS